MFDCKLCGNFSVFYYLCDHCHYIKSLITRIGIDKFKNTIENNISLFNTDEFIVVNMEPEKEQENKEESEDDKKKFKKLQQLIEKKIKNQQNHQKYSDAVKKNNVNKQF